MVDALVEEGLEFIEDANKLLMRLDSHFNLEVASSNSLVKVGNIGMLKSPGFHGRNPFRIKEIENDLVVPVAYADEIDQGAVSGYNLAALKRTQSLHDCLYRSPCFLRQLHHFHACVSRNCLQDIHVELVNLLEFPVETNQEALFLVLLSDEVAFRKSLNV